MRAQVLATLCLCLLLAGCASAPIQVTTTGTGFPQAAIRIATVTLPPEPANATKAPAPPPLRTFHQSFDLDMTEVLTAGARSGSGTNCIFLTGAEPGSIVNATYEATWQAQSPADGQMELALVNNGTQHSPPSASPLVVRLPALEWPGTSFGDETLFALQLTGPAAASANQAAKATLTIVYRGGDLEAHLGGCAIG